MSCTIHGLLDTAYAGSLAFGISLQGGPPHSSILYEKLCTFLSGRARIWMVIQNVSEVTNRFEYDVNVCLRGSFRRESFYI